MLKPAMNKHFFAILLLLLCLLFSGPAEARLTLGIVPETQDSSGEVSLGEANELAELLTKNLQEEVVVKEFADYAILIKWIDRFAMLDLALLSSKDVEANPGRFLSVGKIHPESDLLLVSRQGIDGAWLQRVAEVLREPGVSTAETTQKIASQPPLVVESAVEAPPLPTPEHADPVKPLAPPVVVVKPLPAVPQPGQPPMAPSTDFIVVTVPELPVERIKPSEPAGLTVITLIEVPETTSPTAEPFEQSVPSLPLLVAETAPPESLAVVEPPAVPQTPIVVEAPVMPQEEITPALAPPFALEVTETPIPELGEVISTPVPEEPGLAVLPQEETALEPVELTEPPTTPASLVGETVDEPVVPVISEPFEAETPFVETVVLDPEPLPITSVVPIIIAEQEQDILEETERTKDFSPEVDFVEADSVLDDEVENPLLDTEILAFLGEDTVASMIAQPDIPQALRPSGIPTVRPSPASTLTETTDELIVASIPEPLRRTFSAPQPQLLPDLVPEPGVIYVIPFAAVMVPNDFNARVFDQFVDLLNQGGEDIGLQFVILKEDLQGVDPAWLAVRQYVTGEIYGYVEDSGCCSTDLRTKVRLIYRRPKQELPAFRYEYPVRIFFEHDSSTIDAERTKVAEEIAAKLSSELLTVLRN